jgi:alkylhydroperoxidase family enzyme
LCKFAEMVTRAPGALSARHLETLRLHGLSDGDILDTVEVISYFNYINRIADALGVDPEPEMQKEYEKWQTGYED